MENKQKEQMVSSMAHYSADQAAIEATRRADGKDPAKTYKEVYGEVYDFLISKHENRS